MTNEFVGFSDRLIASGSPSEENIRDVRSVLGRFLELSKKAARDIDNEAPEGEAERAGKSPAREQEIGAANSGNEPTPLSTSVLSSPMHFTSLVRSTPPNTQGFNMQRQVLKDSAGFVHSGFSDPYRNTIWTPPISPDMDNSIVPHILSGRDSFSSRLYFETINLAVRSLQGEAPWEFAASIFRYKLQYASREKLFGVLAGVLEMLLLGTNQVKEGGVPQREVEENGAVKAGIVGQILAQGGSESEYLSSWEVEWYLNDRWALDLTSTSVRIQRRRIQELEDDSEPGLQSGRVNYSPSRFAPTVIPGFFSPDQIILNSEGLIEALKMAALTIGAGPRWHVTSVDNAVTAFLRQNNAGILGVLDGG
jgi:hypothetical protein